MHMENLLTAGKKPEINEWIDSGVGYQLKEHFREQKNGYQIFGRNILLSGYKV